MKLIIAFLAPALFYVLIATAAFVFLKKAESRKQFIGGLIKTAIVGTIAALFYLGFLGLLISGTNRSFAAIALSDKAKFLTDIAFADMSTIFYLAYILLGVTQIRVGQRRTKGGQVE